MLHRVLILTLALLWLVPITASAGRCRTRQSALCQILQWRLPARTAEAEPIPLCRTLALTKKGYIENIPDDFLILVISKGGVAVGKSGYMPAWESPGPAGHPGCYCPYPQSANVLRGGLL